MSDFEVDKIYNEDCLATMARMPDGFVDCVVTSPPYYGLRSYSAPDSIWGGDKDCEHTFNEITVSDKRGKEGTTLNGRDPNQNENRLNYAHGFCACGAWKGQLGLEPTFQLYLDHLIQIFAEVKRVLKKDGSVWVNLGDSFGTVSGRMGKSELQQPKFSKTANESLNFQQQKNGARHKSLMNIPARFAIRMTDELQFIERNEIIWHKPACMPSSAKDRFTVDFEKIFFFTKSEQYYFEQQMEKGSINTISRDQYARTGYLKENRDGFVNHLDPNSGTHRNCNGERNMRTTWSVNYEPSNENHFASYPTKLVETPIRAGCKEDGIVYDPFAGTGTTLLVAYRLGRHFVGSEISDEYCSIANERLAPCLAQGKLF